MSSNNNNNNNHDVTATKRYHVLNVRPSVEVQVDGDDYVLVVYGHRVSSRLVRIATGACMIGVSIFLVIWVFFLW